VDAVHVILLASAVLTAAFLYSAVGHGGASAYIAAMALAGIGPAEMRPVALQLNVLVSALATYKFCKAGHFRWGLFWPFAITSIPAAYLGGAITLPGNAYKVLVGLVLLYAAGQLWWSARKGEELRAARMIRIPLAMVIGAALGVLSGLTGVGGGIFLSPLLLLMGWAGTKQTSATSAPFILVNSLAGLAAGLVKNPVPPPDYAWWLMGAVLIGGWIGSEYGSRRFANPLIRQVLALVLAIAGGKMVLV
jgi:uncharacterized membrane protein YfcA